MGNAFRLVWQHRDIEEGFVDRKLLDEWREIAKDAHDITRGFRIGGAILWDDDEIRTQPHGSCHRHRRADTMLAGGV